jgi:hypothetical protein
VPRAERREGFLVRGLAWLVGNVCEERMRGDSLLQDSDLSLSYGACVRLRQRFPSLLR